MLNFQEFFDIFAENHLSLLVGERDLVESLKLGYGIPHREVCCEEESVRAVHIYKLLCALGAYEGQRRAGVEVNVIKAEINL